MDNAQTQLIDRLKTANNVLVTVSRNPSVDQLAALLGLTLFLNKQGKHAAAVFSGAVPSTIEFLKPDETIEKTTDSLRDFIIALDKSKADKLRYKVEDNVVRIFITPYRTSITQEDLEFSQGDFNVDVVVAIGVQEQGDLDEAITAHGRILHDATIASITTTAGELGSINWQDTNASSLSELVTELIEKLDKDQLDGQIATALLTGIVAETERFSNAKTSAQTMSVSSKLMAAGANQQLVASELENGGASDLEDDDSGSADLQTPPPKPPKDDGTIEIDHDGNLVGDDDSDEQAEAADDAPTASLPAVDDSVADEPVPTEPATELPASNPNPITGTGSRLITEAPQLGGMLTANTQSEQYEPAVNPMNLPSSQDQPLLDHDAAPVTSPIAPTVDPTSLLETPPPAFVAPVPSVPEPEEPAPAPEPEETAPAPAPEPTPAPPAAPVEPAAAPAPSAPEPLITGLTPPPPAWVPPTDSVPEAAATAPADETLAQLEEAVDSPHTASLDDARGEVQAAIADTSTPAPAPAPIEALNAQPFGGDLHPSDTSATIMPTMPAQAAASPVVDDPLSPGPHLNDILGSSATPTPVVSSDAVPPADPNSPPPVPPPIPFQFGANGNPPAAS